MGGDVGFFGRLVDTVDVIISDTIKAGVEVFIIYEGLIRNIYRLDKFAPIRIYSIHSVN